MKAGREEGQDYTDDYELEQKMFEDSSSEEVPARLDRMSQRIDAVVTTLQSDAAGAPGSSAAGGNTAASTAGYESSCVLFP